MTISFAVTLDFVIVLQSSDFWNIALFSVIKKKRLAYDNVPFEETDVFKSNYCTQ